MLLTTLPAPPRRRLSESRSRREPGPRRDAADAPPDIFVDHQVPENQDPRILQPGDIREQILIFHAFTSLKRVGAEGRKRGKRSPSEKDKDLFQFQAPQLAGQRGPQGMNRALRTGQFCAYG